MERRYYQAGERVAQPFAVRMNLYRAGFTEGKATLLARWVEFWCQQHCFQRWHVDQTDAELSVSFESDIDAILFMISEEYSYFVPAATTRPKAQVAALPPAFMVGS